MSEKKMSTMSERWAVEFSGATVLPVASVKVISCYPAGRACVGWPGQRLPWGAGLVRAISGVKKERG